MFFRCDTNTANRYRLVERDEAAFICCSQGEQVGVGHLLGSMYPRAVEYCRIEDAHRAGPILMVFGSRGLSEQIKSLTGWNRAGVAGLADDPHESVLGDRAGGPPVFNLVADPRAGSPVVNVIAVEERQQHVDIQQRSAQTASSSRSRSMSSLETALPR